MGILVDGVYYKDRAAVPQERSSTLEGIHESGNIERIFEKHAHELIQPYNPDGTPNQAFIDYYPEDAKKHGMIPESEQ